MNHLPHKLRPPLKTHGGKSYLARRIIARLPPHRTYIEPFAGGLSVLLNKPPVKREIAVDIDPDLMRFWETARDYPLSLASALQRFEYTEDNFRRACEDHLVQHGISNASVLNFVIRNRFSRGGLGRDFAWSERLRGGQPGDRNAWETFVARELPLVIERIRRVVFLCRDGIEYLQTALQTRTQSDAVVYCDPPYLQETRSSKNIYEFEMTTQHHEQLLEILRFLKCKVFLSGYRSSLYDEALRGWTRHEFDMPNHSGQGKTKERRLECLWESPDR